MITETRKYSGKTTPSLTDILEKIGKRIKTSRFLFKQFAAAVFTIIICCWSNISSAQVPQRVLDYYKNINLAELAICDSNFEAANQYYKAAFAINWDKAFSKDLSNAFYAAIDSREYSLAEKYLSQLLHSGLDAESESWIKRSYAGEAAERINNMFKKYPNHVVKSENGPLIKELTKMAEVDRDVRMYFSNLYNGHYMVDSVYYIDYKNAKRLLTILTEKDISIATLDNTGSWIIIYHNSGAASGGKPAHIFDTLLYKKFLSFDCELDMLMSILEPSPAAPKFQYDGLVLNFPFSTDYCFYKGKIYAKCYDDTSEARINKERQKIGLAPLCDVRKRIHAYNKGLDSTSYLHRYTLRPNAMTVMDIDNEASLKMWLSDNGEAALVKQPYDFTFKPTIAEGLTCRGLTPDNVIGKTTYSDMMAIFKKHWIPEYDQGKVYYADWQTRSLSLCWNCHATVLPNSKENLATDSGRRDKALFIPGYIRYAQYCWGSRFGEFRNIQCLFDKDSLLISITAFVDPLFYKPMMKNCGVPTSVTVVRDSIKQENGKKLPGNKITIYTWKENNFKTEIKVTTGINNTGHKFARATCQMMDTVKYAAYMRKVNEEKVRLDKEYASRKN